MNVWLNLNVKLLVAFLWSLIQRLKTIWADLFMVIVHDTCLWGVWSLLFSFPPLTYHSLPFSVMNVLEILLLMMFVVLHSLHTSNSCSVWYWSRCMMPMQSLFQLFIFPMFSQIPAQQGSISSSPPPSRWAPPGWPLCVVRQLCALRPVWCYVWFNQEASNKGNVLRSKHFEHDFFTIRSSLTGTINCMFVFPWHEKWVSDIFSFQIAKE